VYVANFRSDNIGAYRIEHDSGALQQLDGSPFACGSIPIGLATDPSGSFLFVTNGKSNDVSAYHIETSGALAPVEGSPFPAGQMPCGIGMEPSGSFVYVANWESNDISAYRLERPSGVLTAIG
jgi:6-phosphogluconolactonase (cycloisomerase 2 family)